MSYSIYEDRLGYSVIVFLAQYNIFIEVIISMDNIQSLNRKYNSIESLLTSKGKVNAKIISKPYFKDLDIYKKILEKSSDLDIFENVKMCDKINFISKNLKIKKTEKIWGNQM